MGFFSDLNRKRKKVTKKIFNPIVKGISKVSDKLIPNELRFLAPYAAGIGSLMLPPGMGPVMRGLMSAGFNAAGQIGANETPIDDISDLNKLSMALAGGLGALGSQDVTKGGSSGQGVRGGIDTGERFAMQGADAGEFIGAGQELPGTTGFMQGAENIAREGVGSLSDYVQGSRSALADIGQNPAKLFKYDKTAKLMKGANPFPGVTELAGALAPTLSLGTADVAYEAAVDAQNAFDEKEAAELAEAGATLEEIQNARRAAIREAMEVNNFTEQEILDTFAEIGLKDGGIASLKNGGILGLKDGGMLDLGGNEMDYRGGGFIPMGSKERADDVPARLSKNEFVMTADAVRAAGGGSVNKGAQRMYDIMNRLEARA